MSQHESIQGSLYLLRRDTQQENISTHRGITMADTRLSNTRSLMLLFLHGKGHRLFKYEPYQLLLYLPHLHIIMLKF